MPQLTRGSAADLREPGEPHQRHHHHDEAANQSSGDLFMRGTLVAPLEGISQ
jgi:hypothetical protein